MNHPCEDHNSRDCGVCHRPVRVTTDTLPADCEGELRDLARSMRRAAPPFSMMDDAASKLESIINRHSGLRPMRSACKCGKVTIPPRAVCNPPGMAAMSCVDGVQHGARQCQRYDFAAGRSTAAALVTP